MELVSPELALVDPLLARRARELLPPPPDCLAPRVPLPPAVAIDGPVAVRARARPSRPSLLLTVLALQVVTLVGSLHVVGGQPPAHPPAPPPVLDRR